MEGDGVLDLGSGGTYEGLRDELPAAATMAEDGAQGARAGGGRCSTTHRREQRAAARAGRPHVHQGRRS